MIPALAMVLADTALVAYVSPASRCVRRNVQIDLRSDSDGEHVALEQQWLVPAGRSWQWTQAERKTPLSKLQLGFARGEQSY